MNFKSLFLVLTVVTLSLSGCASTQLANQAFNDVTALKGNTTEFNLSQGQVLAATKQVMIRHGFAIDSVDTNSGLIKATREFSDNEDKEKSYKITASAYVTELAPELSSVALSASQQTTLHRQWTTWWHLLWIIPIIPTGTEYQTVVVEAGNITDKGFYNDFFKDVRTTGEAIKAAELKRAAEKAEAERIMKEKAEAAAKAKAEAEAKAKAKAEQQRLAEEHAAAEAKAKFEEAKKQAIAKNAARVSEQEKTLTETLKTTP